MLHHGDCINFKESIDMIYCDPPYAHKTEDQWYGVGETLNEYLSFMKDRFIHFKEILKPDSNILVHVDWKAVHYLKVIMDEVFGINNFRNEIIWCFSNPSVCKSHLPRKHQTILWYGMGDYTFNEMRISYNGKLNVGGKTSWSKEKLDTQDYLEKGKLLEDWWSDIPALCRNEKEKLGYDTQKPLKLMERIVLMFSNEGQTIYDPFCGSGSLLEAGKRLNRNVYGSDISEKAINICKNRLEVNNFF